MRKTHLPFVVVILVFLIIASLPPLIQYLGQTMYKSSVIEDAKILANNLGDLSTVNIDDFANATGLAKQINIAIEGFNIALKTDFLTLDLDQAALREIQEYAPLVQPYNELIHSSHEFNVNDQDSVNQLYIDAYILGAEATLIEGKIASEATHNMTAYANPLLKLGKLRTICGGECYSEVLGKIHKFIEDYAINIPDLQGTVGQLDIMQAPRYSKSINAKNRLFYGNKN